MKSLNPSCREATRLLSEREERALTVVERSALMLHLAICKACGRFEKQLAFMHQALGRWRNYSEDDALR